VREVISTKTLEFGEPEQIKDFIRVENIVIDVKRQRVYRNLYRIDHLHLPLLIVEERQIILKPNKTKEYKTIQKVLYKLSSKVREKKYTKLFYDNETDFLEEAQRLLYLYSLNNGLVVLQKVLGKELALTPIFESKSEAYSYVRDNLAKHIKAKIHEKEDDLFILDSKLRSLEDEKQALWRKFVPDTLARQIIGLRNDLETMIKDKLRKTKIKELNEVFDAYLKIKKAKSKLKRSKVVLLLRLTDDRFKAKEEEYKNMLKLAKAYLKNKSEQIKKARLELILNIEKTIREIKDRKLQKESYELQLKNFVEDKVQELIQKGQIISFQHNR